MTLAPSAALAAALKAAAEHPGTDSDVTSPDGTRLRIGHPAVAGLRCEMLVTDGSSGSATVRVWEPVAERPAAYPAEIPFLAQALAAVIDTPGTRMVQWPATDDPDAAFDLLSRATLAEGWEAQSQPPVPAGLPLRQASFRRGAEQRLLMLAPAARGGIVSLTERSSGHAG